MPHPVIFTDLDGTLLDPENYGFTAALPALDFVKAAGIPLVFCSSKTRAEIEYWRERLENSHPFISENGGAIFLPLSYFSTDEIGAEWEGAETIDGYVVLVLGIPYRLLRDRLQELQRNGFEVRGFGDMSAEEVAEVTGLNLEQVKLAKKREFDEPFVFFGEQTKVNKLLASIEEKGLRHSEGRFYHLMGDNDKGRAVDKLKELYQRRFGDIVSIAIGDSPVDFPMLERVDYPVLVRNYKGEHDPRISLPNLIRSRGVGPEGWNETVLHLLGETL
jgi:mannosyl-3-phosphoglycerate phosphatase